MQKGYRKLRTVDADVVVFAISMFHRINVEELWLAFSTSSSFRYIPIHEVVNEMDPRTCMVLPVFHSFTGCDLSLHLEGEARKVHGIHGKYIQKLLMHLKAFSSWKRLVELLRQH